MNYIDSFIAVADDCPASEGVAPQEKGGKKTVAVIQYELLLGHPYEYTQEDVLFKTHVLHKGITAAEPKSKGKKLREDFFEKEQPCLRTSPLARRYGWGFHFDPDGKVAMFPVGSKDYDRLSKRATKVMKAMRTSRA